MAEVPQYPQEVVYLIMEKRSISVDLKGKTALVTGGAKGIGEAISRALAANRANIVINYNTSADSANIATLATFLKRSLPELA